MSESQVRYPDQYLGKKSQANREENVIDRGHMNLWLSQNRRLSECKLCGKVFHCFQDYNDHMRSRGHITQAQLPGRADDKNR